MIHTLIGNLGYFFTAAAFSAAAVSFLGYAKVGFAGAGLDEAGKKSWLSFAGRAFAVHGFSVFAIIGILFYMIYNHYYEYHYVWSHSSDNLPTHFMISCFWEGQEGSFLLWIFWQVLIGGLLIWRTPANSRGAVMAVFALVQTFLVSMILGTVFFESLKIGSSPFVLLRDVMGDQEIFRMNPDFVPEDGNGLNPLLQNYWMVIHPPTLFLGFALTLVPFSFCIAGLYTGRLKEWIKPALPWAHATGAILGLGIAMGAYWAYETLNFGGYWNWDPVENAVYIPWLTMIAAIHLMVVNKRKGTALQASVWMTLLTFILILYSTFLTRSGILGESSVHSFTDLGLSGQLLIYLLAFTGLALHALWFARKKLAGPEKEVNAFSPELWVFLGAAVLSLAAFQVLLPISIPVMNSFVGLFGIESDMAPPADQVEFYNKFQIWFAVGAAFLSGAGQIFWWNKIDKQNVAAKFQIPAILTMLISAACIAGFGVTDWKYIILLTASVFTIVSNSIVMIRLVGKTGSKLSGGSMAHLGLGMMLLGILASSGYDKVISMNNTGLIYNRSFSDDVNKENLLLFRNQGRTMTYAEDRAYTLTYKGLRTESEDLPGYPDREKLIGTADPYRMVLSEDYVYEGETVAVKGDTVQVFGENTYYEIEYEEIKENAEKGDKFTLFPRVQKNPQMGTAVSPALMRGATYDLYTHVTAVPDPEEETEWGEPEDYTLSIGDTFTVNDFVAVLDDVRRGEQMNDEDVNVFALIRVLDRFETFTLKPVFFIKGNLAGKLPDENRSLGVKITLESLNPENKTFKFTVRTTERDWVILKAVKKPLINFLWIGTLLVTGGFAVAARRRFNENRSSKKE